MNGFIQGIARTKMNLPLEQLFWRAVLANWLVCLGVWMAARTKDDTAKVLLIWWCMFTFITCGFEHSVANMCGLMLGLLLHCDRSGIAFGGSGLTWTSDGITWAGYIYNVTVATVGNIVGGAVFVAGVYWIGSPKARELVKANGNGQNS